MGKWDYQGCRTLKERQEKDAAREAQIQAVWDARSKPLELARQVKRQKKKTTDDLLKMVEIDDIFQCAIRPVNAYIPRSYNVDKQVAGMLNHMFVRYPVPYFMYKACLPPVANKPFQFMKPIYRNWFITLAQGGSFSKKVKGVMTSKEAFLFLKAPVEHDIHENVWWAKLKFAGIPEPLIEKLIGKVLTNHYFDDPDGRLAELINFYAKFHHEMNKFTFDEITDFVAWKLLNDRNFRFRGRTVVSMANLANEWQILMQKAKLGTHVEWPGFAIPKWEYAHGEEIWEVTELLNNKELANEGRKQKHCVYSYVNWCSTGYCSIFSLRGYRRIFVGHDPDTGEPIQARGEEMHRVTVEVNKSLSIAQVRGRLNSSPSMSERQILKLWAGEKGFTGRY